MTGPDDLGRLAALAGIHTEFVDTADRRRVVADDVRRAILAAMRIPAASPGEVADSIAAIEERRRSLLPPVTLVREDDAGPRVPLVLDGTGARLEWEIEEESGAKRAGAVEVDPAAGPGLALPGGLSAGYHRLRVRLGDGRGRRQASTRLIVAPPAAWRPPELTGDGRLWGIAAQLYATRSARNWGIGDFTDLGALVEVAGTLGAAAVGINPLHALFPDRPAHASPYSPSHRAFLNDLYIDVEAVADFPNSAAAQVLVGSPEFQGRLGTLRRAGQVDYAGVAACKRLVLEALFRTFRETCLTRPGHPRAEAFRRYQAERGQALARFALFQVLLERRRADGLGVSWRDWPAHYRTPDSPAVAALAESQHERCQFHAYLQWQAEEQRARAGEAARRHGLAIGIYGDLALGADGGGAEAWSNQDLLAPGVTVGAPPDSWSPKGQNWGFPPYDPGRLAEAGFAAFIEPLRAAMRHGGGVRIDHVLGLMRLYWIPEGASPDQGAYVSYPWRELLGIVALESRRHRSLVVGEDLGTVPEGMREALAAAGVLSYRLLYFEKDQDGRFQPPAAYPREALIAVGTHDLPPLAAFWAGLDIELRARLGLWPTAEAYRDALAARADDRTRLAAALTEEGLAPPGGGEAPVAAAYAFLARAPSRLLMVQLEDALGQTDQMNVPGTVDQYPNWRFRLTEDVAALAAHEGVRGLAEVVRRERPPAVTTRNHS